MKLLHVESHGLVRDGVRAFLQLHAPEVTWVADAPDARSAYALADQADPDVVMLEVALPGVDGIAAARELRRRQARRKVLFLSTREDPVTAARAFAAGAHGYVLKREPATEMLAALRVVAGGQTWLSPALPRDSVLALQAEDAIRDADPLGRLTARERQVFDLLVRGLSNPAMARELFISAKTVETHRARVLRKLGVHSVVELVRFAARNGLLSPT
jgi:two-component system, NarL family, response regulator NreC